MLSLATIPMPEQCLAGLPVHTCRYLLPFHLSARLPRAKCWMHSQGMGLAIATSLPRRKSLIQILPKQHMSVLLRAPHVQAATTTSTLLLGLSTAWSECPARCYRCMDASWQ